MNEPFVTCFYKDEHGNIYVVKDIAIGLVNRSKWIVFTRVYPVDYTVLTLPYADWCDGRFEDIEYEEYLEAIKITD